MATYVQFIPLSVVHHTLKVASTSNIRYCNARTALGKRNKNVVGCICDDQGASINRGIMSKRSGRTGGSRCSMGTCSLNLFDNLRGAAQLGNFFVLSFLNFCLCDQMLDRCGAQTEKSKVCEYTHKT